MTKIPEKETSTKTSPRCKEKKHDSDPDENMEWALDGLIQENHRLRQTLIYYRVLVDSLQKKSGGKPRGKRIGGDR